jgi:hypothetical protein
MTRSTILTADQLAKLDAAKPYLMFAAGFAEEPAGFTPEAVYHLGRMPSEKVAVRFALDRASPLLKGGGSSCWSFTKSGSLARLRTDAQELLHWAERAVQRSRAAQERAEDERLAASERQFVVAMHVSLDTEVGGRLCGAPNTEWATRDRRCVTCPRCLDLIKAVTSLANMP